MDCRVAAAAVQITAIRAWSFGVPISGATALRD